MKKIALFLLLIVAMGCNCLMAQSEESATVYVNLDGTVHDSTLVFNGGDNVVVGDDGGMAGSYTGGHDYHVTIHLNCAEVDTTGERTACIDINRELADVDCLDRVYVYDGPTITSPLMIEFNNCSTSSEQARFYVSPSNTTGDITIRFVTGVRGPDETIDAKGFQFQLKCEKPCEVSDAVIDHVFDRTDLLTGEIVEADVPMRYIPNIVDTIFYSYMWVVQDSLGNDTLVEFVTDSIIRIDTLSMTWAALLCEGQGAIFHGHGEYGDAIPTYDPTDVTSMFNWVFDDYVETPRLNKTDVTYNGFQKPGCLPLSLQLYDERGCPTSMDRIEVRVAINPIKTIFDLDGICNVDSLLVNVGYEGDNGTLTLKPIEFLQNVTKTNPNRVFIPDGPNCPQLGLCFTNDVLFTEYGSQKIKSASDICSICINYEHSFMGDYRLAIQCPTYNEAVSQFQGMAALKWGKWGQGGTNDPLTASLAEDDIAPPDGTNASNAGGGDFAGYAYDHEGSDGSDRCDSLQNPFGVGLDYCFSRNGKYTLITGDLADSPNNTPQMYISETSHKISLSPAIFDPIPPYFTNKGGQTPTPTSLSTRTPSDPATKTNYYRPASDFSTLIGCPLNGNWSVVVCDFWGADNGWVFGWSMEICGANTNDDCFYQVGIDSVRWLPDTNYTTDFRNGEYHGLVINQKANDPLSSYISSPDTAGNFNVKIKVYDEFGCVWNTHTPITTVYTPIPNLGNDTNLCGVDDMMLDATDKYTNRVGANYSYTWEPYGQSTAQIMTTPNTGEAKDYVVEVRNDYAGKVCTARDTIKVSVRPQPLPNFDPGVYPLESCEPFTINFTNTTTDGYLYRWDFGDGTYSTLKNPSHTYAAGVYDLKYYVESDGGCRDSLIYNDLIHVFPQAKASFSWEPTFPTVLHPSIQLVNTTTPDYGNNHYVWEIQYEKDNPVPETFYDRNPIYTWTSDNGGDVSGNYFIRLMVNADNHGPSGNLVRCGDTVETTILVMNDNLIFPNVVTPNGDGLNDRFVIENLVEGLAYPINELDIFDKWGSRVFHASNITSDDDFWDPARTNSPAGTYFYRFTAKGYKGNIEHNGVIELLK